MDKDGTHEGYDIELTRSFSERLDVPIIASGGANNPKDFIDVFKLGKADAALAASIFHYNEFPIQSCLSVSRSVFQQYQISHQEK